MPWGNTWSSNLSAAIATHFLAMFGRELVINRQELDQFLNQRKFKSEQAALAHFSRVMQHYKEKYAFVPRFSHLLTAKIQNVETTGWEAQLYDDFPDFAPVAFVPAKTALDGDVQYGGLFDSERCTYFHGFASRITEHPSPVYCYNAAYLVERLIFSLAKTRKRTDERLPIRKAIEAHRILMAGRRPSRDKNKTWRFIHFSKTLVKQQVIQLFGQHFNFWELPKMLVDQQFAEQVLNCRLTPGHIQAIFDVLSTYGYKHRPYLPYVIKTRSNFILRYESDKTLWSKMKPGFVCEYPF